MKYVVILCLLILIFYLIRRSSRKVRPNCSVLVSLDRNAAQLVRSSIPEPTRSLLWVTNDDASNIQDAMTLGVIIKITDVGVELNRKENGFYSEPSLIWTQLPVEPNNELETRAMYWPSYAKLHPRNRYQYLMWLNDVTQPTNLSYVFLYYYGLERHLLAGNYDAAVDEILRLLVHHSKSSFRQYAVTALIVASLAKKRMDIIQRAPFALEEEADAALALRLYYGTSMTADDIVTIASRVGFTNRRYIKLHPDLFRNILQKRIDDFERNNQKILASFTLDDFKMKKINAFGNLSIPEQCRIVDVPMILENSRFQRIVRGLLTETHDEIKKIVTVKKSM